MSCDDPTGTITVTSHLLGKRPLYLDRVRLICAHLHSKPMEFRLHQESCESNGQLIWAADVELLQMSTSSSSPSLLGLVLNT